MPHLPPKDIWDMISVDHAEEDILQPVSILPQEKACQRGCQRVCQHREIDWQLGVDLLPDGTSSSLLFVAGVPHWDHIVSIHLVHGNGKPVSRLQHQTAFLGFDRKLGKCCSVRKQSPTYTKGTQGQHIGNLHMWSHTM